CLAALYHGDAVRTGGAEVDGLPDRLGRGPAPVAARLARLRKVGMLGGMRPPSMPSLPASPRIAFLASKADGAQGALEAFERAHGQVPPEEADVLVALGGDGFMLQTLHRHGALGKPVYGMKLGSVGFLMNHFQQDGLLERIRAAEPAVLRPLEMIVQTESGASVGSLAYNEVSLLRQTRQAAHLSIGLNGQTRLDELICDGVLVA